MKYSDCSYDVSWAVLLGAFNGVIYSGASFLIRKYIVAYLFWRETMQSQPLGLPTICEPLDLYDYRVVTFWWICLFTLTAYLLNICQKNWRITSLRFWIVSGFTAIAIWNILGLSLLLLQYKFTEETLMMRLTYNTILSVNFHSPAIGMFSVIIVIFVNFFYAILLKLLFSKSVRCTTTP